MGSEIDGYWSRGDGENDDIAGRGIAAIDEHAADVGQSSSEIEGVVAVQAAQLQRVDASRMECTRHERADLAGNLNGVRRAIDVEELAVVGAIQFENVFAATGAGESHAAGRADLAKG